MLHFNEYINKICFLRTFKNNNIHMSMKIKIREQINRLFLHSFGQSFEIFKQDFHDCASIR